MIATMSRWAVFLLVVACLGVRCMPAELAWCHGSDQVRVGSCAAHAGTDDCCRSDVPGDPAVCCSLLADEVEVTTPAPSDPEPVPLIRSSVPSVLGSIAATATVYARPRAPPQRPPPHLRDLGFTVLLI